MLNSTFSANTAQEVAGFGEVDYRRMSLRAGNLLDQIAVEHFGEPLSVLREMLSGVGIYDHMLKRALGINEGRCLIEGMFLNVLLKYIGAAPVSLGSLYLQDFFTLDSTRIQCLIDVVKSRLPLSENGMERELNALLSALRPDDRSRIVNTFAWFNKEEGSWVARAR